MCPLILEAILATENISLTARLSSSRLSTRTTKTLLLGALYLSQTAPKAYLKYLPVIMREQKASLKRLSSLALFSLPELLKPVFALLLDFSSASSPKSRKRIILYIQLSVFLLFVAFSRVTNPSMRQLGMFFTLTNLLLSLHDSAVDGLAVQLLLPSEQPFGAFGQYVGYKLGGLVITGVLPVVLGEDHNAFCKGILAVIGAVFVFTTMCDVSALSPPPRTSPSAHHHSDAKTRQGYLTQVSRLLSRYTSLTGLALMSVLFLYKAAEHGLDFVWSPMLVDQGISRREILRTQFLVGGVAAVGGAWLGSRISTTCSGPAMSLAVCALLRLVPEGMQLLFAKSSAVSVHSVLFVAVHSVLENVAGSAVTSCMFSFLLAHADEQLPAASYALMNTMVLLGMRCGEFLSGHISHVYGYVSFCSVAYVINVIFPALVLALNRSRVLL
eukprot:gene2680-5273_t